MAVSEKITIACNPDRIQEADITSGADASASLAAANVQSLDIMKPWRCGYRTSRHSWLQAAWIGNQQQFDLEAAAFIDNLSKDGLFRIRIGSSSAPTDLWERMGPTSRVSYSNATADDGVSAPDVTEVDEDCDTALSSPDGGTRLPPGSGGANVVYAFGLPATTCLTGFPVHEFRVIAGLQNSGLSDGLFIALHEAGSPVSGASWTVLNEALSTTLREYVFQWDAADLADSSGADVEIRLSTGGATGTVDVLIEAVEWNQYPTGDGGATYDTGVSSAFDTFASQQFGDAALADGFAGVNWLHGLIFAAEQAGTAYFRLEMWDRDVSARKHGTYKTTGIHDEDWLPVEVGILLAGPVYVPSRGMLRGWSTGVKDYGVTKRNKLGSSITRATFKKRKTSISLKHIPQGEATQNLLLWLGLYAGKTIPFVLFVEPQRTGVQTLQNSLSKLTSDINLVNSSVGASAVALQCEEW